MQSFKEFTSWYITNIKRPLTEANLSGKRTSGENAWDSYIESDPDWSSLEIKVTKDSSLKDVLGKPLADVKKGDQVKLLSKSKMLQGKYFVAHVDVKGVHGWLPLTVLSKPLYGDRVKNKGDVTEGILAAALTAKFLSPESKIDVKEIHGVLDKLRKAKTGELNLVVQNKDKKDRLRLMINLAPSAMSELLDVSKANLLKGETRGAAAFANSAHVQEYTQYLSKNGQEDYIEVISDGISDQKGTKVDLKVKVNGKPTNMNLSLKSGSTKQLGQVAGVTPEKQEEFWKLFGINPVDKKDNQGTPEEFLHKVYSKAAILINQHLGTDEKELAFIKQLAFAIKHAAVLGDETVSLVQLSAGSFKVLKFADIEEKLKKIKLEADYDEFSKKDKTQKVAVPTVNIKDKTSGKILISLRVKRESRDKSAWYYRNYIEKGPLLIELTEHKK